MLADNSGSLIEETEAIIEQVNKRIGDLLLSRELPVNLHEAISYSIFPGGKRVRPTLALLMAADIGISRPQILEAACAIEIMHCASLIHDDLPALDNDEMRRGKPSCHVAFSEATAVLAGDTMISLALELAAFSKGDTGREFVITLSRAFTELCAGQQLDLLPENQRGEILEIHRLKTGALFAAAASLPAIAAGLSAGEREIFGEFGETLGTLFQVTDDYLDIYGAEADRGRPGGSDIRNMKETVFFSNTERKPQEVISELEAKLDSLLAKIQEIAVKQGASKELIGTTSIIEKIKDRLGPLPS